MLFFLFTFSFMKQFPCFEITDQFFAVFFYYYYYFDYCLFVFMANRESMFDSANVSVSGGMPVLDDLCLYAIHVR